MTYFMVVELSAGARERWASLQPPRAGLWPTDGEFEGLRVSSDANRLWATEDLNWLTERAGPAKLREKAEGSAWSEAKLERALADQERTNKDPWEVAARAWLADMADGGEFVRLFLHWYSAALPEEPEEITIPSTVIREGRGFRDDAWVQVVSDVVVHRESGSNVLPRLRLHRVAGVAVRAPGWRRLRDLPLLRNAVRLRRLGACRQPSFDTGGSALECDGRAGRARHRTGGIPRGNSARCGGAPRSSTGARRGFF